jgi:hypothetical protein
VGEDLYLLLQFKKTAINASPMNRQYTIGISIALIALIVLGRALPHVPNFAPVAASALLAGYLFRSRLMAIAVPMVGMLLSDLVIGTYDWRVMAFVYAGLAIPALLGRLLRSETPGFQQPWLRPLVRVGKLAGAATGSALVFFVLSNFGVWVAGSMYAYTAEGLAICYTVAIPFLKSSLSADLLFSGMLFGAYQVVSAVAARRAAAVVKA